MRLSDIAKRIGGEFFGTEDPEIRDVAEYEHAAPDTLSVADSPLRLKNPSKAAALIVPFDLEPGKPGIRCENPMLGFIHAIRLFRSPETIAPGIHSSAQIDDTAHLGVDVSVGPQASIGEGARVGDRSAVGAGARVGERVKMGADCVIHPNCVLYPGVQLGDRVVVHAGSVIGSDGFGYIPDEKGELVKFPQTGTVVVEDDVEIGANVTIDRAAISETRIGRGTKIDNLVQVGHNVRIGENCAIVSQVGISGSVRIGDGVLIGGQVGIADHVEVGDRARLGAQTGVSKNLEGGKTYLDAPAAEIGEARRRMAAYRRLPELMRRVGVIESKLKKGEK